MRVHGNADDLATSWHLLLSVRSMSPQALQVCRILTLPQAGGLFISLFTEFPKYVYSVDSIPTALTPSVWSWDVHICCRLMEPKGQRKAGTSAPSPLPCSGSWRTAQAPWVPVLPAGMPLIRTSCQLEFQVLRFSERGPQASSISITCWDVTENRLVGPS